MPNAANVFGSKVGRVSAVLTTGEVDAIILQCADAHDGDVQTQIDFTIGSLTDVTFRFYVSDNGTTWRAFKDLHGNASYSLTATANVAYQFILAGAKFFKVSFQGSGTVTNSLAALTYKYLRRGSQD